MIDCVFILLIFFIVTTVFVEEPGIEIVKPRRHARRGPREDSIIIATSPDKKVGDAGRRWVSPA